MSVNTILDTDVITFLSKTFSSQNVKTLSIQLSGTSEVADGFLSEINFVTVTTIQTNNSSKKSFNVVVKSGQTSELVRQVASIHSAFANEAYMYREVFPKLQQFEISRGIEIFDSFPKCYGILIEENREILILKDMRAEGFLLNDKTKALPRKYIDAVMEQYGHLHAISAAMQDQKPKDYQEIIERVADVYLMFSNAREILYKQVLADIRELCTDIDPKIMEQWIKSENYVESLCVDLVPSTLFQVITHGDCWNNNFLFKTEANSARVILIDWQLARSAPPVYDLSSFLFSTLSPEDFKNLEEILNNYYGHFSNYVRRMGSDPDKIYPKKRFLEDWKNLAHYGIIYALMMIKVSFGDKEKAITLTEAIQKGLKVEDVFMPTITDIDSFKQRVKCIIESSVANNLIK